MGSPARAGIDPKPLAAISSAARFPRTRGDRPGIVMGLRRFGEVPPHARG